MRRTFFDNKPFARTVFSSIALTGLSHFATASLLSQDVNYRAEYRVESKQQLASTVSEAPASNFVDASTKTVSVSSAVVTARWNLDSLTERAMQVHPALSEIEAKIDAAYGVYVQSGLQPNPMIGYQGQQIGSGGRAEQHGITFGRDFVRREKIERSQAVATAEQNRLRQELDVMRMRVATDLRIAYYQAIAAQRQYDLSKELLEVAEKGEKLAEQLRAAKEVSKIDVIQASVEKERASISIDNATNRVRATWQVIATLAGLATDCPEELDKDCMQCERDYVFCDVLTSLKANSPEIAAANATIQRNAQILGRARVEPLPNINVQSLVNWQDNGIGGKPDGGVQVALPIPIRNKNQGAIHQAIAELRAAEFALHKLELDLQNRLSATYEKYANAKSQEDRYNKTLIPQAKESLDLTRLAYKENEVTIIALLSAQRSFFELSIAALETTRQRRIAEAEMDGMLLVGSVSAR